MFYFDWKKVYDSVEGNISRCNLVMEMLINKQIPRNKFDRIYKYSQIDYSGTSFLVHPDVLVHNAFRYSSVDMATYYALASLRSLPEYLVSKKATLDLLHLPVDPQRITNNRLLRIEEDGIHFLYEEVTTENTH